MMKERKMFIYWMWGRSEIGVVFASTETEAREMIVKHYNLTIDKSDLYFKIDTFEKKIFLEDVKENDDVIEVYEG